MTVRDALKSYLALAGGITELTRQRALSAAKALAHQGEATAEQVGGLAEDLLAQTRQNREAVVALVSFEVDRALARVGLATSEEVVQLTDRVRDLEKQLRATTAAAAAQLAAAAKAPAEKAPAKKAPAEKAPAKKAPAKKAPAKKAPAKTAAAETAAAKDEGTSPA